MSGPTNPDWVPLVTVGGQPLPGDMMGLRIDRRLGLVGRATVRVGPMTDWQPNRAFGLDQMLVVKPAGGDPIFEGLVTGLDFEQSNGIRELLITADDAARRFTLATRTTAYVGQAYSGIVKKIAANAGLTVRTKGSEPQESASQETYYLQSGTDLEFLEFIAQRIGMVWWVEPGNILRWELPGHTDGTVDVPIGDRAHSFSVKASALKPSAVDVVGWNPAEQREIVGTALISGAQGPAKPAVVAGFPGNNDGQRKLVVRDSSPLTPDEATSYAKSIAAAAASDSVRARGEVDFDARIAPAVNVKVAGAGPADGTYRVSGVEHTWSPSAGFRTRFTSGPIRPSGLVDVLGAPSHRGGGHLLDGVVAGVVTNVEDPKQRGRVKVKFSTQGDQVESTWARMVTVGGGKSRGLEFQPEIGDEVLLAFELGDTRRPVVLGGLYSDKNTLPTSKDPGNVKSGAVTYRRLTSRLGHVLEFADGDQPTTSHVLVELGKKKHRIRLGMDGTEVVVDNKPIKITNGQATLTLAENGNITIEGNNITLKAKANVKVEAAAVGLKATAEAKVEGAMVKVAASGMGEFNGGGKLALKAGLVAIN